MRVVRPDRHLGIPHALIQIFHQRLNRIDHVPVPQVPRRNPAFEHLAVILFGAANQPRVLLGVEVFVLRHAPIAVGVIRGPLSKLHELAHHFRLTRSPQVKPRCITIRLRIFCEIFEAGIAVTRPPRAFRIDFIEVIEH